MKPVRSGVQRTVVMFAYYFPPSTMTGAVRPGRFFRYLPRFGFSPLVITATPQPPNAPPNVIYQPDEVREQVERSGKHSGTKAYAELLLRRFVLGGEEGITWSRDAAATADRLVPSTHELFIFSTSPPLSTHMAALQLLQRRKGIWVADFRDPVLGNPFRSAAPLNNWTEKSLEQLIMQRAAVTVANTDTVAAEWFERYPDQKDKIRVIWNGYDPEVPVCALPIPPRKSRVIAHAGTLYGGRHPGMLLSALERLAERNVLDPSMVRVLQVGPVAEDAFDDPAILGRAVQRGFMETRPPVSRDEAHRIVGEADGLLLIDLNKANTASQVPAKLFEYIQIGRPILALTIRNSPTDRILAQSGVRYRSLYVGDSDTALDQKVTEFLDLPTDPVPVSEWTRSQFEASEQTRRLCDALLQSRSAVPVGAGS